MCQNSTRAKSQTSKSRSPCKRISTSPWSLEREDSCAFGFETFRFGDTFGFRVAIILLSLSLATPGSKMSQQTAKFQLLQYK